MRPRSTILKIVLVVIECVGCVVDCFLVSFLWIVTLVVVDLELQFVSTDVLFDCLQYISALPHTILLSFLRVLNKAFTVVVLSILCFQLEVEPFVLERI